MCGIAGARTEEEVRKKLIKIAHRGPDDNGMLSLKGFVLGMVRLKIVDLESDGLCPYQEDNFACVFNGEIYNHNELRLELQTKGWVFRTRSDTEVLVKAYRQWGKQAIDRFNGMFAFAISDGNTILLARDIAGEKPLYYKEKSFEFASEAKALGFDCQELSPASYLIYDIKAERIIESKEYWVPRLRVIAPKTAVDELESLLNTSVLLRTRTDVPCGLYRSNGIDSTLLSTFHDFEHQFTYTDGDKDEFIRIFPKILYHLDYPITSFSPYCLWKLAEMASKKVKVVISGEGADELFGGYVRYILPHFNHEARKQFPSYQSMFSPAESVGIAGWKEFRGNMRELLRQGDRMAAAFGMENRCPFLDKDVIEFAFSLPDNLKIQGTETKILLRRLLEKRLPSYTHIEKHGLTAPVNEWIGSNNGFGKDDYMKYQRNIWKTFQ